MKRKHKYLKHKYKYQNCSYNSDLSEKAKQDIFQMQWLMYGSDGIIRLIDDIQRYKSSLKRS